VVGLEIALVLMAVGAGVAWLFRRFRLSDVVGYVVGGAVSTLVLLFLGVDVSQGLSYVESIKWLGLVLFYFSIGVSIGFKEISKRFSFVVASELVLYVVVWIAVGVFTEFLGLGYFERLALFILFINSSTIAVATLTRGISNDIVDIVSRAFVQTNAEDVFQLTIFSLFFLGGALLTANLIKIVSQVLTLAASTAIVIFAGEKLMNIVSRSRLFRDRETKFVFVVGLAIVMSSIISLIGLPPLFGAFLAGSMLSLYTSLDDVRDMVEGIKILGLLLYFVSIGSSTTLQLFESNAGELFIQGVLLGFIGYATRFLGLSLAFLLTEGSLITSLSLATYLVPMSEVGIILIDTLAREGIVGRDLVALATISVLTTFILYAFLTPRISSKITAFEGFIPRKLVVFFENLGKFYTQRIDVVVELLKPLVRFVAIALIVSHISTATISLINRYNLPYLLAVLPLTATTLTMIYSFITITRRITKILTSKILPKAFDILSTYISIKRTDFKHRVTEFLENLGLLIDLFIAGVAIVILIQVSLETIKIFIQTKEPLAYLSITLMITSITIIATEFLHHKPRK
jgi:Kef-type K+ transport system membrane component KefB